MKKDNRGVSLVELIIVISIMVIVAGGFIIGINVISGKPATKCAQRIVYSLERHRTTAMGKANATYLLRRNGNGDIIVEEKFLDGKTNTWSSTKTVVVGEKSVSVSYDLSDGSHVDDLDVTGISLGFERGTGAFKATVDSKYCTYINVSKGNRSYRIKLEQLTGKVYIE